jgi:transposase-like protein
MPQKMRLTLETRLLIVKACINGKESVDGCVRQYGIGRGTVQCWIRLYQSHGVAGLTPSSTSQKYEAATKINAVRDYLSGLGSLNDICLKYNISRHGLLQRWIIQYNNHGDFKQPNSGGAIYMVKGRNTTLDERIEIVSHCIAGNKDYGKTIERYGVSYQQVYGWVRKCEQHGADGLVDRRGRRKDEASMTEVEKLRAQLKLKEAENYRLQMENELLKKLEELERGRGAD